MQHRINGGISKNYKDSTKSYFGLHVLSLHTYKQPVSYFIYLYNIIVLSFSGSVDSCIAGPAKDQQKPCQNRARVRIYIMLLKGKRIYVWHLSAAN